MHLFLFVKAFFEKIKRERHRPLASVLKVKNIVF